MASQNERLAESLVQLKKLQESHILVVSSSELTRTHQERLIANGFLQEIMKGWYVISRPEDRGDTSSFYVSYWDFINKYLYSRFKENWSLSPEQSLLLHSGNKVIPDQLIVRSPLGGNNKQNLIYDKSIFVLRTSLPIMIYKEKEHGLNIYSIPEALVMCSPSFFQNSPIEAKVCLSMIDNSRDIIKILLSNGYSSRAGKVAGALLAVGKEDCAKEIVQTMKDSGYRIKVENPFNTSIEPIHQIERSPYISRIKFMWKQMRETVVKEFTNEDSKKIKTPDQILKSIEENYKLDAYHSLSIEGYKVSDELIERVRSGQWDIEQKEDHNTRDALAARGYYLAFLEVKSSIEKILHGTDPGQTVAKDYENWYKALFTPSVEAGILKNYDLIGYRTNQVYIKGSLHTPLSPDAVRDVMPTFFSLIEQENNPAVRAVLGHFFLTYIHPHIDGNGRMARFLMNSMLTTGGHDWIIIPVEKRNEYIKGLEEASVKNDISTFTKFVSSTLHQQNQQAIFIQATNHQDFKEIMALRASGFRPSSDLIKSMEKNGILPEAAKIAISKIFGLDDKSISPYDIKLLQSNSMKRDNNKSMEL